jgi:formylglycine-generating enzyme required for sulfatase activity
MHGNVNEWCEDILRDVPLPQRIHRGGCWEFEES